MRCLICGKEKLDESIFELWNYEDPLCLMCRKKWERIDYKMNYEGYPLEASYLYNEAYASALIQFKECNDEALKSIFLYGLKEQLRWKYKGYHLVFAPSSIQKIEKRGFSHLEEIFSELNMPYIDAFEKIDELSQKEKMGKERKDIVGKIVMKEGVELPGKIVIVDDVMTTGSTLSACLEALSGYSGKIKLYTLSIHPLWTKQKCIIGRIMQFYNSIVNQYN